MQNGARFSKEFLKIVFIDDFFVSFSQELSDFEIFPLIQKWGLWR